MNVALATPTIDQTPARFSRARRALAATAEPLREAALLTALLASWLAVAATLLFPAPVSASDASAMRDDGVYRFVGFASDPSSQEALYEEAHRIVIRGQRIVEHRVDYRLPGSDEPFSVKTIRYDRGAYTPEFEMRDMRDGYVEGARYVDGVYRLFHQYPGEKRSEEVVDTGGNVVVDAGFDRYVRDRLPELLNGKQLAFRFGIAGRLDEFRFRARVERQGTLYGTESATLIVEPSSLLRLLLDPIRLTYDANSGTLLRYEGITNIRKADGNRYRARIDYRPDARHYVQLEN